jgi:predicted Zn-dependent peptidase
MISALYKMNYNPDHAAISVVGDFNSKEMKAALTVLFSKWKKSVKRKKVLLQNDCHPTRKQGITQIKKMLGKPLYIGAPGVSRNNPIMLPLKW